MTPNQLIDQITLTIASRQGYPYALGYLKGLSKDLIGLSEMRALEVLQKAYKRVQLDYRIAAWGDYGYW